MAITYQRFVVASNTKSSVTTDTFTFTTTATPALTGDVIVLWASFDNTASTTAPVINSISAPATETNSWVQIASLASGTTTAAAGVRGEMWAITATTEDWIGFTATVQYSAAVTAHCYLAAQFDGASTAVRSGTLASGTSTTGAPSATTTGTTLQPGDLIVAGAGWSNNSGTATYDADTTNGTFQPVTNMFTSGGSAATNLQAIMQYKVVTAAGSQTFNPTYSSSIGAGAIMVALQPAAPVVSAATTLGAASSLSTTATVTPPTKLTATSTLKAYPTLQGLEVVGTAVPFTGSTTITVPAGVDPSMMGVFAIAGLGTKPGLSGVTLSKSGVSFGANTGTQNDVGTAGVAWEMLNYTTSGGLTAGDVITVTTSSTQPQVIQQYYFDSQWNGSAAGRSGTTNGVAGTTQTALNGTPWRPYWFAWTLHSAATSQPTVTASSTPFIEDFFQDTASLLALTVIHEEPTTTSGPSPSFTYSSPATQYYVDARQWDGIFAPKGATTYSGTASLRAVPTLSASSSATRFAATSLSAASALTAGATATALPTLALSAISTLSAAGSVVIIQSGAAALSATSTMTVAATLTRLGVSALSATSTLAVSGVVTTLPSLALSATSTMSVTAVRTAVAVAALSATSSLSATSLGAAAAQASLSALATLSVAGTISRTGLAVLSASSILTADAGLTVLGLVDLSATSSLTADGSTGGAASYTPHSVNPTFTWNTFNDGQALSVANPFYTTESGWQVTGARIYYHQNLLGNTMTVFAQGDGPSLGGNSTPTQGAHLGSVTVTSPAFPGWVDITFDTPFDMPVGHNIWIGYYSGSGNYEAYNYSALRPVQASDSSALYLGNIGPDGGLRSGVYKYSPWGPPFFGVEGCDDSNFSWGVDIIAGPMVAGGITGQAALSATSSLTADGSATAQAALALSASSSLSVGAGVTEVAQTALTSTSSLSVAGTRTVQGAAALSAASTLAVSATDTVLAQAALVATSSLSTTATLTRQGLATLSAVSTLVADGRMLTGGAAALSASSSLVVAGAGTTIAAAALTATSSLTTSGLVQVRAVAALSATSTLTVAAASSSGAMALLSAASTLSVTGRGTVLGLAALSSSSALAVSASATVQVATALAGTSTLLVGGDLTRMGAVALSAASSLVVVASIVPISAATAALQATSLLSAEAISATSAGLTLQALSTLSVAGGVGQGAAVDLQAVSFLSTTGERIELGAVDLTALATLSTAAELTRLARVDLVATAIMGVAATRPILVSRVTGGLRTSKVSGVVRVITTAGSIRVLKNTTGSVRVSTVGGPVYSSGAQGGLR